MESTVYFVNKKTNDNFTAKINLSFRKCNLEKGDQDYLLHLLSFMPIHSVVLPSLENLQGCLGIEKNFSPCPIFIKAM